MHGSRVLITGFGPFPGVPENPSGWLAESLVEQWLSVEPERNLHARVLPTEWEATALIPRLCETLQPDVMIHFGVCLQAKGFRIEHSAHNRVTARLDARGALPSSPVIRANGDDRLDTPFPAGALARHLKTNGVAAATSYSAGQYVCNYLYYLTLDWARQRPRPPLVLFAHVPPLSSTADGFSRDQLLAGAGHILRFAVAFAEGGHAKTSVIPAPE